MLYFAIVFFGQLQGDQKASGDAAAAAATNGAEAKPAAPSAAPEKMVALKSKSSRLDEDAFFSGKSKGGKTAGGSTGGQKKGGKAKALKLDMSIFEALEKVKVSVPVSHDDIASTIEALEGRKTY